MSDEAEKPRAITVETVRRIMNTARQDPYVLARSQLVRCATQAASRGASYCQLDVSLPEVITDPRLHTHDAVKVQEQAAELQRYLTTCCQSAVSVEAFQNDWEQWHFRLVWRWSEDEK